jgi:agmatine deiminase
LARFVDARTVLAATESDPSDANYQSLAGLHRQLRELTDQDGQPLEIVPLPMPKPLYFGEQRLPACYCNFYIANGVVVVPQFDDAADARAISILAEHFPSRRIVGIRAVDLIWGLGAFHCITQQQPA